MASISMPVPLLEALVQPSYAPTEPGAAVIVVRDGETIFRRGLGMAHLELGVPIEPEMVFRLGSITKQFTAVAVLMLAEQGALALDDPITKFIPDYPTHGHRITVEHLLTHTSGIKSYTELPEWPALWRKDLTVPELIDLFKNQPMQFAPGERWAYNNSGYVLLGALIEKISGRTYGQFMQQRIFEPLGMAHTGLDDPQRIIPRRVAGYERGPEGYINAPFLSMTHPYAAGALVSTVDDLAIWDAALYTERLLKAELLERAFTSYRLSDGTPTRYGYGWGISEYQGRSWLEHGGGINGFRTYAIRIMADHVFVAALSNNPEVPLDLLAFKIAALVIGHPYEPPEPIELSPEALVEYVGEYEIDPSRVLHVTCEDAHLFIEGGPGPRVELLPLSPDEFFYQRDPLWRYVFIRNADGGVRGVEICGRAGVPDIARKLDQSKG